MEETYATSLPHYKWICNVPEGVSLQSVEKRLQRQGYATHQIRKPKGAHLNDCELQIRIKGRKATFGISNWDRKRRRVQELPHAYVRGSYKILEDAVSIWKDIADEIKQKEKVCNKLCEIKDEDCGGYCNSVAEKHYAHECENCNS